MSTVDAAIINYITNGGSGGGGGGVVYTAGDGISIANNQIGVKYNTNTMEIVNGALSAKVSSSGGGGGSSDVAQKLENEYGKIEMFNDDNIGTYDLRAKTRGVAFALTHDNQLSLPFYIRADYGSNYPELNISSPNFTLEATKHGQTGKSLTTLKSADFYTEGNLTVKEGFAFSAPNVYTKQEVDTMFASGGNKDEDTMTKLTGVVNVYNTSDPYVPSGGCWWIFAGIPKKSFRTGLIIKMYNNRSSELESYVLIRKSDDLNQDLIEMKEDMNTNGSLVSLTSGRVIAVYLGQRELGNANTSNAIIFAVALNTYDEATESNGGGVFEVDHMSHGTLVKIACNYHTTGDQSV
jgi:hypothetical protein